MAWTKFKARGVAGAVVLLAIAIAILITGSLSDFFGKGRLRLPVGKGRPAISLGERHGLILASDGSLWSWGSDFLGWPVLGLGNLTQKSTVLRRIGKDSNWVGISAGIDRNLAVKSDGTLWTWGESVQPDFYRQLGGRGSKTGPLSPFQTPIGRPPCRLSRTTVAAAEY